jgi:hypothetical protein
VERPNEPESSEKEYTRDELRASGADTVDRSAAVSTESPAGKTAVSRRHLLRRLVHLFAFGLIAWLLAAYVVLPMAWRRYEKRHPALDNAPRITHTGDGIPGDPLNISLVSSEADLQKAMLAAHWYPADPITLESSLKIAVDSVFRRPDDMAPVSNLYLFGRKQDLAFEKPIGGDPRRRHHVRFWRSVELDEQGRPLWLGAATLDTHVGVSHTEGQITHHIGPDIDAERDLIINDLTAAGYLERVYWIDDFQQPPAGRNGGGDPWHTDGRMAVGVLGHGMLPEKR